MKQFYFFREIAPIDYDALTPGQSEKALEVRAEYVYRTYFTIELPQYIVAAAKAAGFEPTRIGSTTYKSSTWGFSPISAREERAQEMVAEAERLSAVLAAMPPVVQEGGYDLNWAWQEILDMNQCRTTNAETFWARASAMLTRATGIADPQAAAQVVRDAQKNEEQIDSLLHQAEALTR